MVIEGGRVVKLRSRRDRKVSCALVSVQGDKELIKSCLVSVSLIDNVRCESIGREALCRKDWICC